LAIPKPDLHWLNIATPENFRSVHIERHINNVRPSASAVCPTNNHRINCTFRFDTELSITGFLTFRCHQDVRFDFTMPFEDRVRAAVDTP
jgi:hypothetical protein